MHHAPAVPCRTRSSSSVRSVSVGRDTVRNGAGQTNLAGAYHRHRGQMVRLHLATTRRATPALSESSTLAVLGPASRGTLTPGVREVLTSCAAVERRFARNRRHCRPTSPNSRTASGIAADELRANSGPGSAVRVRQRRSSAPILLPGEPAATRKLAPEPRDAIEAEGVGRWRRGRSSGEEQSTPKAGDLPDRREASVSAASLVAPGGRRPREEWSTAATRAVEESTTRPRGRAAEPDCTAIDTGDRSRRCCANINGLHRRTSRAIGLWSRCRTSTLPLRTAGRPGQGAGEFSLLFAIACWLIVRDHSQPYHSAGSSTPRVRPGAWLVCSPCTSSSVTSTRPVTSRRPTGRKRPGGDRVPGFGGTRGGPWPLSEIREGTCYHENLHDERRGGSTSVMACTCCSTSTGIDKREALDGRTRSSTLLFQRRTTATTSGFSCHRPRRAGQAGLVMANFRRLTPPAQRGGDPPESSSSRG